MNIIRKIDGVDAIALMAFVTIHNKPNAVKIKDKTIIIDEKELEELLEEMGSN